MTQVTHLPIGDLDRYFDHLKHALGYQTLEGLSVDPPLSRRARISFAPPSVTNSFLAEEVAHFETEENVQYPLPSCDFLVQRKKDPEKKFPNTFMAALHLLASLSGNIDVSELRNVIDKVERRVGKHREIPQNCV